MFKRWSCHRTVWDYVCQTAHVTTELLLLISLVFRIELILFLEKILRFDHSALEVGKQKLVSTDFTWLISNEILFLGKVDMTFFFLFRCCEVQIVLRKMQWSQSEWGLSSTLAFNIETVEGYGSYRELLSTIKTDFVPVGRTRKSWTAIWSNPCFLYVG